MKYSPDMANRLFYTLGAVALSWGCMCEMVAADGVSTGVVADSSPEGAGASVQAPVSMVGKRICFTYTHTRYREGESLDGVNCEWKAWQSGDLSKASVWVGQVAPAALSFPQENRAVVRPAGPDGGFMLVATYTSAAGHTATIRRELAFSPNEPGEESGEYVLTFDTPTSGTAVLQKCFGGENCFECENISFVIQELSEEEIALASKIGLSEVEKAELDEMCSDILTVSNRWSATSKLYVKRIITLAPLVEEGADVDVTLPETKGNTLLHYACAISNVELVAWLVNHGADVNKKTNKGATPLDCVSGYNAAQIRAFLIQRGAKK